MSMWMSRRASEREYLDDQTPPQAVVDEVYRFLGAINRWLGGARATLARFESFSHQWPPGARINVLDVACGGGDLAHDIVSWGRARGFDVRVTGLDISASALTSARRLGRSDPRLAYVCGDIHQWPCRDRSFDYVSCSLYFHHLTDDAVVTTLRTFDRLTTRGIVVNDLIRRRRHYVWSWIFTRPVQRGASKRRTVVSATRVSAARAGRARRAFGVALALDSAPLRAPDDARGRTSGRRTGMRAQAPQTVS